MLLSTIFTTHLLLSGWWAVPVESDEIVVTRLIRHSLPPQLVSVFGSDVNGRCTSISGTGSNICNGTSVLNDGIIPALSGVSQENNSEWAAQLFTMRRQGNQRIILSVEVPPGINHDSVQMTVFNCPPQGIYAPVVNVYGDIALRPEITGSLPTNLFFTNETLTATSCDHLIKFCVDFRSALSLPYYILEFPYQNNSDFVFLNEVTFSNLLDAPCPPPELITMSVTPSPPTTSESPTSDNNTPTDTSAVTTTSAGAGSVNTTTTTRPASLRRNSTVIIIAVIVVLLLCGVALVVVVLAILLYLRIRKRKYEEDKVQQLQSVVMETREGEKGDGKLFDDRFDSVEKQPQNGVKTETAIAVTNALYSDPNEDRNNTYSRLREGQKTGTLPSKVDLGDDQYSKLNVDQNDSVNTRSTPAPQRTPADVGDMYAVPGKTTRSETVPAIPSKSTELVEYLHTKETRTDVEAFVQNLPEYSEIDRRSGSTGPVPLSNPASHNLFNGLSSNPLYHPMDVRPLHMMPVTSTQSGNGTLEVNPIYAEPVALNVHEPQWNLDQNIYESVYSEALNPSLFMREREDTEEEDLYPYSSIYASPIVPLVDKPLSVSVKDIKEIKHLGNGNFGQVVLAKTVGLTPKDLRLEGEAPYTLVAVKKLKPSASKQNRESFDKEVQFMSRLNHPNVIRLLAVCTDEAAPFIMMEYMTKGDLNQYLNEFHSITRDNSNNGKSISQSRLIYICTQIASAMQYLALQNFVHRDLATRNCLVGSKDTIKIADFGMSRSLYESSYYVISGHAILPVRWMATECFYGKFSAKTDVWAFGVTMWEVFMLAKEQPYDSLEDREVVEEAIKGPDRSQLERPAECPENIYSIMKKCWIYESNERPTFDELHKLLSES